jgi:hypothetical protein
VKPIGRKVTGVQADSADLDDLDQLFDAVGRELLPVYRDAEGNAVFWSAVHN